MKRHLHIDPLSGISGDMFLGLLIQLGLDPEVLAALPAKLGLEDVTVRTETVMRGALSSGRVLVEVDGQDPDAPHHHHHSSHADELKGEEHGHSHGHKHHHHGHEARHSHEGHSHSHDHAHGEGHASDHGHAHHTHDHSHSHGDGHHHHHDHAHGRNLAEMKQVVEKAKLPERAHARAMAAIDHLFVAEAKVHGQSVDAIHLHEAGGDDALIDIIGTCLGLDLLEIDSVSCSTPIPIGGGTVHSAHGVIPVPAPATVEILKGVETIGGPVQKELVTPTGAALLRGVVDEFGVQPSMSVKATGFGAGKRNDPHRANVARGLLGTKPLDPLERQVTVLEFAVDDMIPQDVPVLMERLLADGARDVFSQAVQMKKGRPGFLITVLCDAADQRRLSERILTDSTSLGVRVRTERRFEWRRDHVQAQTPWGPVSLKRALDPQGRPARSAPEFEDVRKIADSEGMAVDRVRQAAERAGGDAPTDD